MGVRSGLEQAVTFGQEARMEGCDPFSWRSEDVMMHHKACRGEKEEEDGEEADS